MNVYIQTLFEQLRLHSRAHFMLSELLFALDEVEDSLRDLHIPALATASFRAHILRYQLLLNARIHHLHFRIVSELQQGSLP